MYNFKKWHVRDLNIYDCHHIYRETNIITDCLVMKCICNLESIIF